MKIRLFKYFDYLNRSLTHLVLTVRIIGDALYISLCFNGHFSRMKTRLELINIDTRIIIVRTLGQVPKVFTNLREKCSLKNLIEKKLYSLRSSQENIQERHVLCSIIRVSAASMRPIGLFFYFCSRINFALQ